MKFYAETQLLLLKKKKIYIYFWKTLYLYCKSPMRWRIMIQCTCNVEAPYRNIYMKCHHMTSSCLCFIIVLVGDYWHLSDKFNFETDKAKATLSHNFVRHFLFWTKLSKMCVSLSILFLNFETCLGKWEFPFKCFIEMLMDQKQERQDSMPLME